VGLRADLDASGKIKISCLFWESNSNSCVSCISICSHGMFQKKLMHALNEDSIAGSGINLNCFKYNF
jgi:hypothetical protein